MEKVVSIRMPKSLLEELKLAAEKNHYMDVSDAIRSVLREKWIESRTPRSAKVLEIKKSLAGLADQEGMDALRKTLKLLEELNEI